MTEQDAHAVRRRVVILTEGHTDPLQAKTAVAVIRYGQDEVVALLDATQAGKTAQQLLEVGGDIPVVARLDDAPTADRLLIGIAPAGGRLPDEWRPVLLDAIGRRWDIVSGLHDFLSDDAELTAAAADRGVRLFDVRKNRERDLANRQGIRADCLRIQTVGQDCSVGKMVVAVEVARELARRGHDAKFVATGQTGIMIEGDGCPVDCVVSDFLNGAVEKLLLANQHHDILLIEGQGSITHPRFSPVTLGLLHGALPQGMILCYEAGRPTIRGMDSVPLVPLSRLRNLYETSAGIMLPSRVIGVALNGRLLTPDQAAEERAKVGDELGLPVCDVYRDGPDVLVDAVLALNATLFGR
jgi:D-glutamate N-acetyltransferase